MNANTMKITARDMTAALLTDVFVNNGAIQFADGSWAIRQIVDNQEIWTEITVKSKTWAATTRSEAFNPIEAADAWKRDKEMKAKEKAEKEAEKATKVKKAKEKAE